MRVKWHVFSTLGHFRQHHTKFNSKSFSSMPFLSFSSSVWSSYLESLASTQSPIAIHIYLSFCLTTPLLKNNRNLYSSVQWRYLFSMYRFEIFHVEWWGLLHSLWKISWMYAITVRLCEHSNLVRFEKRAAKTLQHGYRYGDILMLYDIITTYEWFFCFDWHELCSSNKLLDFPSIHYFLVKYAF